MISEPTLDPEHIAGLLEEEPRRRNSTNSMPSPEVSKVNILEIRQCVSVLG